MKKEKIYNLSLVVLMLAIVFLVWDGCSKKAQLSAFKETTQKLKLGNQSFNEKTDKLKNKIAEQNQIILTQEDALEQSLLIMNDFRKIQSQVRIVTKIKIDSVFVPYEITKIDSQIVYLCSDRKFNLSTKHYSIYGITKKEGVLIDSLHFNSSTSITIGNKSQGLFKKSKPIVEVKYDNPFITTQSMSNIVVEDALKWYDKKRNWFLIGAGLTLISTILLIP